MRIKLFLLVLLLVPVTAAAGGFTSTGAGGGGWMHSGAILPTDSDVIVMGADVSGVYRTNDFGATWRPWNDGLLNHDQLFTHHIEDLLGIDYEGWAGFFAATKGGIYWADNNGDWESMTPIADYYVDLVNYSYYLMVPFSCLDWSDTNLVVAGTGHTWWISDHSTVLINEANYYPALDSTRIEGYGDSLHDDQWTVWTLDMDDANATWTPDLESNFGPARDVSVAIRNGTTYIAVGTSEGIYVKDPGGWRSVGDSLYDDEDLVCWSLHLTDRGTLYAGMGRTTTSCTTGVYRLFDIETSTTWTWVGDGDTLPPDEESLKTTGARPYEHLIYMSVVDGDSTDPDLIYLATRASGRGLFRGYQPYSAGGQCAWKHKVYSSGSSPDFSFYYRDSSDEEQDLDVGWLDHQSAYVVFHPVVSQYHPDVVALHLGGRLHVSDDAADSWTQCYTEETAGGFWATTGYKELAVADIAFMSDGRALSSTGDEGLFRSRATDMDDWEPLDPPSGAPNRETNSVEVRPDWRGTGEEVIVILSGDVMQGGTSCRLYWIDEDDDWHYLTRELLSARMYKFFDFAFSEDDTCFIAYAKYDDTVGDEGSDLVEFGVLRGVYNHFMEEWSWTSWNGGLTAVSSPTPRNARGMDLLYHEPSGRVFLAARETNSRFDGDSTGTWLPGALYMLESSADTGWEVICGGTGTTWLDFRCLAQSADGGVIYAGTRGATWSNFIGSVLKCENPADTTSTTWTPMINKGNLPYPFDFEPLPGTDWADTTASQRLTYVRAIAVDPGDADIIFVGQWTVGFMEQGGLWKYDGSDWTQMSDGRKFDGISINALAISTATGDSMLVVGTHGLEMYLQSTDDYNGPGQGQFEPAASAGLKLLNIHSEVGGRTEIEFALDRPGPVRMKIFDVRGRLLHTREADVKKAGPCSIVWDGNSRPGRPCASGIYFLRLSAGDIKTDRKFLLIR